MGRAIKTKTLEQFGLARDTLLEWAELGIVRTVKFGEGKQARRVYCWDDIATALERMAVGLEPEVQRR